NTPRISIFRCDPFWGCYNEETESGKGGDEVSESKGESDKEETRQEEEKSFDPIPRTPEGSEDESNDEEDQELRLSEEARIQEEEEADELYRDVNINQGRGLQVTQNVEDSHVTLSLVNPNGPQESSSVSSFATSLLNPISDAGVESIFTTASSPIVSLQTPTPIMTHSTIATITTSSDAPIPSTTIPSIVLKNLPTFNSAFCFDERLRSLETTFSEYRQTNLFVDAVSAIPGIVHQYITQQMTEAIREVVQIQTDRLQYSLQRENDEFLRNIDENMKKIIKGQVKSQVKEQVSRILPRIEESMNATLEAEEGPSAGSDRGSKRQKEGGEHASASTPSETTTGSTGRTTTGQMEELLHPVFETGSDDQPIVQTSQHPEWFSQPRRPPSPDRDWNKTLLAAQGDAQSWISDLARQTDARSSFNELLDTPIDFSNFIMNRLNEVYKATTDQLDWVNPEGQQYPHNLLQPLPLIPDNRGRRVISFDHFINNDLEYLRGGSLSRKYTTSVTKTKAADYGHIKWIEDLVPRAMWIQEPINYDRHALWGVSH
nr:hypothetical protein [Tanacetum cinerariifolium]